MNIDSIHIFDRETEENILPRIPEYNYIDCSVENNILNVLGEKEKLPSSINIADGEYKMLLNVSSFKTGGNIHGNITETENISGINLATIDIEGKRIFAVLDNPTLNDIHLKIDYKKAIIQKDNKNIIEPLPMINSLEGKLVMGKIKAIDIKNGKKQAKNVNNYSIIINNSKFSVPDIIIEKIFTSLSNRKAFNNTYIFEFSPYNCYFSDEGIDAILKEIIDYGDEKFAHCITKNNEDIYVYFDGENPNSSKISINFNEVSIIEKNKKLHTGAVRK